MYTLIAVLIFCLALSANGFPEPRIVGGSNTKDGKYPFQVSLLRHEEHFCGGSILNSRFILTAAHCIAGYKPKEFSILVGTNNLYGRGDVYPVEDFISHKEYDSILIHHDIGLVTVSKNITFNDKVQTVVLPSTNYISPNANVTAIGWGQLGADLPGPNILQEVALKVMPQDLCQTIIPNLENTQICTFTKVGEGVCRGDSGGPLIGNGIQIGLVSYGVPCAEGVPDVYTKIYPYRYWITQTMNGWTFKKKNNGVQMSASFCMIVVVSTILQCLRWN